MLALAVVAVLAACGATRHSLGRPAGEVAIVKGSTCMLVVDSGKKAVSVDRTIVISAVDGEDLKSALGDYPDVAELLPGHRMIVVTYRYFIDGKVGPKGTATLELDAVAGKTYQVSEHFGASWAPTFFIEEEKAR